MSRTSKIAALLTALSLTGTSAIMAQSADSTRTPPPRPRRQFADSTGAARGQFPRDRGSMRGGGGPGAFGPRGRGFAGGGPSGGRMSFGGPGGGMLRGITLSDAQRKELRSGRVKHLTTMKPLQVEMISARADAQIAQLNGDQKALDAANARLTTSRDQMRKLMQDRSPTTDLRNVLTPDQQKLFDKNMADGMRRRASMMRGMQRMRGMGQMRGMNGMRAPGGMGGGGFRPGMMRRGFGPGAPGGMPGEGMRPGMGPRRYDDEEMSDNDGPAAFDDELAMGGYSPMLFADRTGGEMMDDFDDVDDADDMDDFDVFGWGDVGAPPPPAVVPRAVVPAPDRRP